MAVIVALARGYASTAMRNLGMIAAHVEHHGRSAG